MPKALHMNYLRSMYGANKLTKGEFEIGGERVDLSKVKIPLYFQASREDHIAPMNSVYRSARAFSNADVTLTLAGSGHIAGVVNAPSANKYQHWVNPALPDTLAEWQAGAEEHPGSWWPHWAQWLHARSGEWVAARDPNKGPLSPLEPAPGSYVKVKS
jgi:polyhydroxyalkanoate synthase